MRQKITGTVAAGALLATFGFLALSLFPASSTARSLPCGLDKIKHIIFIIKENRSFDTYFGRFPGADGATYGRMSTGELK